MPLTQKHRSSIYQTLSPLLGEEEAEALLSQFPERDNDELVTRGDLSATESKLRVEIAEVRTEVAVVRTEVAEVRTGIAELRAETYRLIHQQTVWFTGAMFAGLSFAAALARFGG